jgi:hypothetical protein
MAGYFYVITKKYHDKYHRSVNLSFHVPSKDHKKKKNEKEKLAFPDSIGINYFARYEFMLLRCLRASKATPPASSSRWWLWTRWLQVTKNRSFPLQGSSCCIYYFLSVITKQN